MFMRPLLTSVALVTNADASEEISLHFTVLHSDNHFFLLFISDAAEQRTPCPQLLTYVYLFLQTSSDRCER